MCVDVPLSRAQISRRGMLGLSAGAAATVASARGARAAALPRELLTHRHANRVVLLGVAGGPPPEIDRAGVSSALVIGNRTYVVDCGRGSVTQYVQARLELKNLRGIFVTHLHADHVIDFYDYFALGGFGVNDSNDGILPPEPDEQPVQIYGPGPAGGLPEPEDPDLATVFPGNPTPGLAELARLQKRSYAYSTNLFMRTAGIPNPTRLYDIHEIEHPAGVESSFENRAPDMEPFVVMDDGFVRVSAVLVPHGPCYPSYAYRFDSEEGSVVFSGDTAYSDNVIRLARGADVLVHEVIDVGFYADFLGLDPALLGHLERSHTDVHRLGELAERAEVDRLVLNHLVPADPRLISDRTWRRNASRGYSGRVVVGDDLKSVRLTPRPRRTPVG